MSDEEFVRRAIGKTILERKFSDRGRRYIGRIIRRARRSLLRRISAHTWHVDRPGQWKVPWLSEGT